MVAAAVIGGVATVAGSVVSSNASKKASRAAQNAADKNNALQLDIYNQNKAALSPYMEAGKPATAAIQALLGLVNDNGKTQAALDTWRNAAGYQDQFAEGQRAVTAALGNKGLLDSGAALKGLTQYGQAKANQSLGQYMGYLTGQQQIGLTGASALAGVGQNYANNVSVNNTNAANAAGNAALSNANMINGLIQSGLSAYGFSQGLGSSYGNKGQPSPDHSTPPYNPGGFNDPARNL